MCSKSLRKSSIHKHLTYKTIAFLRVLWYT